MYIFQGASWKYIPRVREVFDKIRVSYGVLNGSESRGNSIYENAIFFVIKQAILSVKELHYFKSSQYTLVCTLLC